MIDDLSGEGFLRKKKKGVPSKRKIVIVTVCLVVNRFLNCLQRALNSVKYVLLVQSLKLQSSPHLSSIW